METAERVRRILAHDGPGDELAHRVADTRLVGVLQSCEMPDLMHDVFAVIRTKLGVVGLPP
jgi:hypothetical protein